MLVSSNHDSRNRRANQETLACLIVIDCLVKLFVRVLYKFPVKLSAARSLLLFDSKELRPNNLPQLISDLLPAEESVENAHSTIAKKVLALEANKDEKFLRNRIANIIMAMLHHRQCRT